MAHAAMSLTWINYPARNASERELFDHDCRYASPLGPAGQVRSRCALLPRRNKRIFGSTAAGIAIILYLSRLILCERMPDGAHWLKLTPAGARTEPGMD
jgi:hypothetical protein